MRLNLTLQLSFSLFLCLSAGAQGVVRNVTFDSPPQAYGTGIVISSYRENILLFTSIQTNGSFVRMGGGLGAFPENGSSYVILGFGDNIAGRPFNGGRFGLYSVDLSEFSTLYAVPKTIEFVGYLPDGGIVTQSFTTDGIIDGTGPLTDFETFYFDSPFSDIVRFEVSDYTYAMDNLKYFQVVPEPSPAALLLLGLPWLARLLRQRRQG